MSVHRFIISLIIVFVSFFSYAQTGQMPKYEYRAVWLTTIENLDWPRTLVKSPADIPLQKRELTNILDSLQMLNVNTVLLQTRVRGDVIYPSSIEPFSKVLTGVHGGNPGYDALAFAIEECHKRGMQLHAWLVTLPLGKAQHVRGMGRSSLKNRRPELCCLYKGSWYMEPARQGTADYLSSLVREIVSNYDVDGIHLDYVRYPDAPKNYPDAKLYRRYGAGLSLAEWRRSNITRIVSAVYGTVKSIKPWVRVSCAPLGKHADLTFYSSLGYNARNTVFQDAQQWLRDGIMDILFPMIYFNGNNFYPFVRDWQENSYGRHVVPGLAPYRLLPEYGDWDLLELKRQLYTSRSASAHGAALFRTRHLLDNPKGFMQAYAQINNRPSLVPPLTWCAKQPPCPPTNLVGVRRGDTLALHWSPASQADTLPMRYNVYMSIDAPCDISDIRNYVATVSADSIYKWSGYSLSTVHWAVTSVDAYGVESEPRYWSEKTDNRSMCRSEFTLPEPTAWGMQIVLRDAAGYILYKGRYNTRVGVSGLPSGAYMLEIVSRGGAVLKRYPFTR